MPSDVMADRRGTARFPLILVAEVIKLTENSVLNARSSAVSRSGCYVDTLNRKPQAHRCSCDCGTETKSSRPMRVWSTFAQGSRDGRQLRPQIARKPGRDSGSLVGRSRQQSNLNLMMPFDSQG